MIQESRLSKTVFSCSDLSPNNNVDLHKVLTKTRWSQQSSLNVISRHYFILGFSYPIPGDTWWRKSHGPAYGTGLPWEKMQWKNGTIQFALIPNGSVTARRNCRPANIIDGCILPQCEITYDDGHVSISYNTVPNRPNCVSQPLTVRCARTCWSR